MIAGRQVGDLAADALHRLWAQPAPVTGKELLAQFGGHAVAHTTLMTVLSRLVDKGLVRRVEDGRVLRFQAAGDVDQLTAQAIGELLVSARDPRAVLAHLVDDVAGPELVAKLAAVLDRARRP